MADKKDELGEPIFVEITATMQGKGGLK